MTVLAPAKLHELFVGSGKRNKFGNFLVVVQLILASMTCELAVQQLFLLPLTGYLVEERPHHLFISFSLPLLQKLVFSSLLCAPSLPLPPPFRWLGFWFFCFHDDSMSLQTMSMTYLRPLCMWVACVALVSSEPHLEELTAGKIRDFLAVRFITCFNFSGIIHNRMFCLLSQVYTARTTTSLWPCVKVWSIFG